MWQKKFDGPKVVPMLEQMVSDRYMAPQLFFSRLPETVAKMFLGASPYYASEMATDAGKTLTFTRALCLANPYP